MKTILIWLLVAIAVLVLVPLVAGLVMMGRGGAMMGGPMMAMHGWWTAWIALVALLLIVAIVMLIGTGTRS